MGTTLWLWSSMHWALCCGCGAAGIGHYAVVVEQLAGIGHYTARGGTLEEQAKGLKTYKVSAPFLVTVTVTFSALLFVPTCQKRNDMHC